MSVVIYVLSIVFVNWAFTVFPMLWGVLPAATFVVGLVFVLRDLAQRQCGHYVLLAMASGVAISVYMASPGVALASGAAFAVSETIDWLVYSYTRRPWRDRILLSSVISTPFDSMVFLALLPFPGAFNVISVVVLTVAKIGVAGLWWGGDVILERARNVRSAV